MTAQEAPLLLVEDEEDDVLLFQAVFFGIWTDIPLHVARDGEEAIEYLEGTGRYATRAPHALPGLVVLDLKLPRRTGLEVLARMRAQERLRRIPVVVLSSSQELADVARARALGIEDYHVKPVDLSRFGQIVRAIGERWIARVRGPQGVV